MDDTLTAVRSVVLHSLGFNGKMDDSLTAVRRGVLHSLG